MKRTSRHMHSGFTIVELLVVLVIIAILAAVIIVSYGTYQERTRDAERKSDMYQIVTALKSYITWYGDYIEMGSNCGFQNNGEGWTAVSSAEASTYGTSIEQCLVNKKLLKVGEATDPTGCKMNSGGICGSGNPTRAYMKMNCSINGIKRVYVLAYLETQPAKNAEVDALCTAAAGCTSNCNYSNWGTTYGMNYYVQAR